MDMNLIPRKFYLDDIFDDMDMHMQPNNMKCDIYEKGGDFHIEIDIPGFDKKDISIECENGYLTVSAFKENGIEEDDVKYIRRERSFGKYERTFYLGDIDSDEIKAEFKNGILKIVVPKEQEKSSKKYIEIGD